MSGPPPPVPKSAADVTPPLPSKKVNPVNLLQKLPNRSSASVLFDPDMNRGNRMSANNILIERQPSPEAEDNLVKDPSYYPGCPTPPSKPAYTTPDLNPKQVATPGSDPRALPSTVSTTTPRSATPTPRRLEHPCLMTRGDSRSRTRMDRPRVQEAVQPCWKKQARHHQEDRL